MTDMSVYEQKVHLVKAIINVLEIADKETVIDLLKTLVQKDEAQIMAEKICNKQGGQEHESSIN